jgi:serpin B
MMGERLGKCVAFLAVLAFTVNGSAMEQRARSRENRMTSDASTLVPGMNQFACDLYRSLRAGEGNRFFSPASIAMALSMTEAGAVGNTAAEMARTLQFKTPPEAVHKAMRALYGSWTANDKASGFQLNIANRLWAAKDAHFLPQFLALTRDDYGAEATRLDFANSDAARKMINQWIEGQTQGTIRDLISAGSLAADTKLVLTNAVYFKGAWSQPFHKNRTQDETFHVAINRTVKTPMMHAQENVRYASGDGFQILELPYGDQSLSLVILLPKEVDGLPPLEEKLTSGGLQKAIDRLSPADVVLSLPRFKTTSRFELSTALKSLGMTSPFDAGHADFSGMTGGRDLFLSAVIHEAFVDVNEEGTEAAAATGAVMRPTAIRLPRKEPIVFQADHPFVFLIRDRRNGALLFLGRLCDPGR